MSWTEIVIELPRAQAEQVSDALIEAGALSVSVEDADLGTEAEQPLFGEPGMEPSAHAWERSRIVALTEADTDHLALVNKARAQCADIDQLSFSLRSVAEQDWVRVTQAQFDPIPIGRNIWVVPSWHAAPVPDALVLELDPGLAFGTGSHPTTRLCMEWLEQHVEAGCSVLDYGCGSGILAILARKLGADSVDGVDIDPQAISAAQDNAKRNQCDDVRWFVPSDYALARASTRYDIVAANILSGPLKLMAPMLASRVAQGGAVVLSGILARQADELIASYAPYIALSVAAEREGWVALAGRKE
ncbi:MAG: 50S ribosomal protein L11 methyltransferase [Burkholderiales bacterium]|nr:50S ribosomal protein L11 methyltransferase [Burkholderiales bacterium]